MALRPATSTLLLSQNPWQNNSHQRTNRTVPDTRRNELARSLAYIDQALAKAEAIAADAEDEDRQSALDFLIEFQAAKRAVEAELSKEK
jgi:hypothetical protein